MNHAVPVDPTPGAHRHSVTNRCRIRSSDEESTSDVWRIASSRTSAFAARAGRNA